MLTLVYHCRCLLINQAETTVEIMAKNPDNIKPIYCMSLSKSSYEFWSALHGELWWWISEEDGIKEPLDTNFGIGSYPSEIGAGGSAQHACDKHSYRLASFSRERTNSANPPDGSPEGRGRRGRDSRKIKESDEWPYRLWHMPAENDNLKSKSVDEA